MAPRAPHSPTVSVSDDLTSLVAERMARVRGRIASAGGGVDVGVVAATKQFTVAHGEAAAAAGCRAIGENYAQEVVGKWTGRRPPVELQFIGRLQRNKVRLLAGVVDLFATVDRPQLVAELAKRAPGARVFVQVDTTAEAGKGGCPLPEVPALVDTAGMAGLHVEGLMTVGPTVGGAEAARPGFREVRALVDRLGLVQCSMGMTDDLEVAVQEGSTQVRVGTALFGPRSLSDT